jgi:hypothetical protein
LNNALMLSALLIVFAGAAGFEVANSLGWCDRRRLCKAVVVIVPLTFAAGGAWWLGNRYPTLNSGFGPGWACQNLGRGDALVCLRDLDARPDSTGQAAR